MSEAARVEVTSRAALRAWLARHHGQRESVWLVTYKKAAGDRYLPYDAIVEEALCFGWIDSLPRSLDADRSMRRLSPRKPGSGWSALNRRRVAALVEAGRMRPEGSAKIDAAKADGSWTRLDAAHPAHTPKDLTAALRRTPGAAATFKAFPPSTRRAILEWISSAKTPATRAKRIAQTASDAARGVRANQYRQPKAPKLMSQPART